MKLALKYLLIVTFVSIASCSLLNQRSSDSAAEFNRSIDMYKYHQGRKALAVAIDSDRDTYALGVAYDYPVQALANNKALDECEIGKAKYNVVSNCELVSDLDQGESALDKDIAKYMTYSNYKALAINLDDDDYSWGYSYGYSSQEEANESALKSCASESRKHGLVLNDQCQLFIIGEDVVLKF